MTARTLVGLIEAVAAPGGLSGGKAMSEAVVRRCAW